MLSRTADNLFWLARYMERADFLARIIEATQRLAALPKGSSSDAAEWESALEASGAADGFYASGRPVTEADVVDYLTFSPDNPSSIRSCIEAARTNARIVRTALTVEVWETINAAWIKLKTFEKSPLGEGRLDREELSRFLEFVEADVARTLALDGFRAECKCVRRGRHSTSSLIAAIVAREACVDVVRRTVGSAIQRPVTIRSGPGPARASLRCVVPARRRFFGGSAFC